jgi:hypothetical protein
MSNSPAKPRKINLSSPVDEVQNQENFAPEASVKKAKTMVDETEQMSQNQNSANELAVDQTPAETLSVKPLAFSEDKTVMRKKAKKITAIICVAALIAGVGTGFGVHQLQRQQTGASSESIQPVAGDKVRAGDVFGLTDSELFKDTAVGYLEEGGINGEGSHKLLRPGGESQTVYLTSAATDLDKLTGMEVKVWGETYKGQQAGWLMDVGKVEVISPDAEPPFEEEL